MHRIRYTKLLSTQIAGKLVPVAMAGPASATPYSDSLVSKSLTINTDNWSDAELHLQAQEQPRPGGVHPRVEAGYGALALNQVVLIRHMIPGSYIKLRDDLYLFNWLEEACNGTLCILIINMRTRHDCGIGYHCGKQGLSWSGIGARARNAGSFDQVLRPQTGMRRSP